MPQAFGGVNVTGSGVVFTAPRDGDFRLEMLTFQLTCDGTAGIHSPVVIFTDPSAKVTARLWDWNEGGPSMTLYYTFGIGLQEFNCTVTTGMMIEHRLPDTLLFPQTTITVASVNGTGATIAGDTITNVVAYGEFFPYTVDVPEQTVPLVPGLLPALAFE